MPAPMSSESEVVARFTDLSGATSAERSRLASRIGVDECYYEGVQYLYQNPWIAGQVGQLYPNLDMNSRTLRVIANQTTRYVIGSASATYPERLDVYVDPPDRDSGPAATASAQIAEDLLARSIEMARLTEACRNANFRRCIVGTYGIGLTCAIGSRSISGTQLQDYQIRAFDAHPLRFMLDPSNNSRNLRDHEIVVYGDAWSASKIRRLIPGLNFEDSELSTIGALTPYEQTVSGLSGGMLFSNYRRLSNTPGAMVYQMHVRDDSGRFGQMYVLVQLPRRSSRGLVWVNPDMPISPFGGDGLPFALIHGHRRSSSKWSIGDVAMMKDAQDVHNLVVSMLMRYMQHASSFKTIVDRRFFGPTVSDAEALQRVTQSPGGVIVGAPNTNATEPHFISPPPANQAVVDMMIRSRDQMRDQTFRSEFSYGSGLKSHMTADSVNRLLTEGDRVAGIRVSEDIEAYRDIASVLLGTMIRCVKTGSPSVLQNLVRAGFDADDLATIVQMSEFEMPGRLRIDESSVRYRSTVERRNDLQVAMQYGAVSRDQYRHALAEMDVPVTDTDQHMRTGIDKLVARLVKTGVWMPMSFGSYDSWVMEALSRALVDRTVLADPARLQAVQAAIQAQESIALQKQMAASMALSPGSPGQTSAAPAQDQEDAREPTVGELLGASGWT